MVREGKSFSYPGKKARGKRKYRRGIRCERAVCSEMGAGTNKKHYQNTSMVASARANGNGRG